jgi:15-cis-phytoene synthase
MSNGSPDQPRLDDMGACYDYCRSITLHHGPNFSVGFRLLPPSKQRAVYATYAFCRFADDIADEMHAGNPGRLLDDWESGLERCYRGDIDHPILVALADAISRFGIPKEPFLRLIEGCRMDLTIQRYPTFDDLLGYCDKVAGTISEMSLAIFGWKNQACHEYGRDLSTALQLTNIARDVSEDWGKGRVYLPQEDLDRFDCPESDLGQRVASPSFRRLMEFQVQRITEYFNAARPLADVVNPDARVAVVLMGGVYKRIADRIGQDVTAVLRERVGMTSLEKLQYALGIQLQYLMSRVNLAAPPTW